VLILCDKQTASKYANTISIWSAQMCNAHNSDGFM